MADANFTDSKIEYKENARERLITRSSQLASMLAMITGEGFESFDVFNDEIKQNYLLACVGHADEIHALARKIGANHE